jgi:excisionase family DNA binding protein
MEPWVFSIAQACEVACVGRTALYEAINAGKLIAHKRGKRTLILAEDLQRWVKSLPPMKIKQAEKDGVRAAAVASENDVRKNKTAKVQRAA